MGCRETVHHLLQVALKDAVQLVQGETDTMVCHPVLRKVVGSNSLGTVSRTDHLFSGSRLFGVLLRLVWALAIPLVMGFFLIRFLQRIDSALPATSEISVD